jgi:class 3 adenylate cyclase
LLYDEGDYFGRTVNLAARLASQAQANQVYAGESLTGTVQQKGFRLVPAGKVELKGIADPMEVFEAVRDR